MPKRFSLILAALAGVIIFASSASADVKPHGLIADGMVLQQGMKVPIWGAADDGEKITVSFQGLQVSTTAADGKWLVRLNNLKAGGPFAMTISGKNTVEIKNVLVGEVWICSGQSNMFWPVKQSADPEQTAAQSRNPSIRLFTVQANFAEKPVHAVKGEWQECGPKSVPNFSAVAYFFGRDLQKALQVPVGLIHTSVGGTAAELWTSQPALEADPQLKSVLDRYSQAQAAAAKAKVDGKKPARRFGPFAPASLYNGMIACLQPYAIRGAIWYQGESNAQVAYEYRTLFPAMIKSWREAWEQGDFPFLFVQLAPFMKIEEQPQESAWAELRDAQLLTSLTVAKTAMAVITDAGDEKDIHPPRKEPAGARLALAARAIAYGEKIAYSGPVYAGMTVQGSKVILRFKHVNGGLVAKGEKLRGFTITGEDRQFHNAQAEIEGDTVIVSCPEVSQPVAVRFGWANYPVVNLYNKAGLPASPFRTDDFPLLTQPKKAAAAKGKGRKAN